METELDGFLEIYRQSDGTDEKVEDLIERWKEWVKSVVWNRKVRPLPFEPTEINFLNSRILDGIYHLVQLEYEWNAYAFARLCSGDYLPTARWFTRCFPDFRIENDGPFGHACVGGNLELVQWVYSLYSGVDPYRLEEGIMSKSIFTLALVEENFEICEWILATFPNMKQKQAEDTFEWTCYFGRLNATKWIFERFPKLNPSHSQNWAFCKACKYGHLETIKWMYETFQSIRDFDVYSGVFKRVCTRGNLPLAQWMMLNYPRNRGINDVIYECCHTGQLPVIQWLHNTTDIEFNYGQMNRVASRAGHTEILQWLRPLHTMNDDCASRCLKNAVDENHLETARWINTEYPHITLDSPTDKLLKDKISDSKCGLELFQWLVMTLQPKPTIDYFNLACDTKKTDLIKWLYSLWPNLSYDLERRWVDACYNGDFERTEWLSSIITIKQEQVDEVLSRLLGKQLKMVNHLFHLKST